MPRKNMDPNKKIKFCNVGLIEEDHVLLRKIATSEQRSMTRQLSVLIRRLAAEIGIA